MIDVNKVVKDCDLRTVLGAQCCGRLTTGSINGGVDEADDVVGEDDVE